MSELRPEFQARLDAHRWAGDRERYDALLSVGVSSLDLKDWPAPDPFAGLRPAARLAVFRFLSRA